MRGGVDEIERRVNERKEIWLQKSSLIAQRQIQLLSCTQEIWTNCSPIILMATIAVISSYPRHHFDDLDVRFEPRLLSKAPGGDDNVKRGCLSTMTSDCNRGLTALPAYSTNLMVHLLLVSSSMDEGVTWLHWRGHGRGRGRGLAVPIAFSFPLLPRPSLCSTSTNPRRHRTMYECSQNSS